MVIQRYLLAELQQHFRTNRQMVFLSGPRQVGKTTIARSLGEAGGYFNWDNQTHREMIVRGPSSIAERLGLDRLHTDPPLCVFDELHKYQHWRDLLKGFFDQYETRAHVLVTGSASLATFRRSGDSLMGRYFPYTLHPVSVAECVATPTGHALINQAPGRIEDDQWESLWQFGGFPEPFLKGQKRFYNRWRSLRNEQLFREDLRDLTRIQELGQVEMLATLLRSQVGQLTSYTYLSKSVRVSIDTVRRWINTLESLYYCFTVRPWHRNVTRALRKEPKYYLWDWSQVAEPGARAENLVASALHKAVNWWTESGRGDFSLHFVRDKQKNEVDFLVTRDARPWFLVEVKSSEKAPLSTTLEYFQKQLQAAHAFQVAIDADYVANDCFEVQTPVIVPARTFLAQLI
ncbi:MAG: ATP-binding protein [Gammaproteobacteria bacterium]|nr:ATP-binding protein [Gammaproteobacteria bacterium]